jgi:hypothetical protein
VIETHFEHFRRDKAPAPHDQLAAGCHVVVQMQGNLALDHIPLALTNLRHVDRYGTGDHRAELRGVLRQMCDPRAPNLIFAAQARDIGTGAPDPAALHDSSPSPRSRHMPGQ